MDYVNSPRPPSSSGSPQPPRHDLRIEWQAVAQLFRQLPTTRLRAWLLLGVAALCLLIVAFLGLSPPYAPLANGLDLEPGRLLAPLTTYLFRNAVINTAIVLTSVYLVALTLGWTWAVTGIPHYARPFLLMPLFIPGALHGLLWRPLFSAWLDLGQVELSLLVTALVMLWRAVPLAAWLCSWNRDGWPRFIGLCSLPILLDGGLVLTLTRGEPFNASHTWMSWLVQQLWTNRAWGYAASMAGALALVVALLTLLAMRRTPNPIYISHGSPLGHVVALLWLLGPFAMPLFALVQSSVQATLQAINMLVDLGALRWLLNGALLWAGASWLAMQLASPPVSKRAQTLALPLAVAMLPITTVALAYLAASLPFLAGLWLLILLSSLFTAGLLMGEAVTTTDPTRPYLARWLKAAGCAALVLAHTFPLQLVMQLPERAWTSTLGALWTLAEAPDTGALSAMLLLYALWAAVCAWMLARKENGEDAVAPSPQIFPTLRHPTIRR